MVFRTPEWIILLPLLLFAGWYWKRLRLWLPLRALALLLVVLILMQPQLRLLQKGMDLWVLFDRSASTEGLVDKNQEEWKSLLERSQPGRSNRIFYLDYAGEVIDQTHLESRAFPGDRSLTKTALAMQTVLALADKDRPARILLFTDGYSTEPLGLLGERLLAQKIPLDYRLLREETVEDYWVSKFDLPRRAQIGEPYLFEIEVSGKPDGAVPVEILRDDQELSSTTVNMLAGRGTLRFTDRILLPGAHLYEVKISPEVDAHRGNNTFERWIEIVGGPRVLLVTKYLEDPVETVLRNQGFDVETVTDPEKLHLGQLTGCKALILNNVPAFEIPNRFLDAIGFFVREQGGGLLMAGGKQSFAAGGYYQSPVDELLPVSMELKTDHRKLAVAMAIVLDRSGSMAMSVRAAGGKKVSKMDLANEGTATAIDLLGFGDLVTVYAVDSEAHRIVPLMNVGKSRGKMLNLVRRIRSTGGGIYVYNGLEAAWKALKTAEVGQRHIILFSDAADSEQPHEYKKLVKEIVDNDGTVSVIGLGTPKDVDAAFLEDIAKRGKGRIFFTTSAARLPNIFAQETVAVARSRFVEDPVATKATAQWYEISSKSFAWLPEIDGYNLSYLKGGEANQGLVSADEYMAPLIAWSFRGTGRTGTVSFPLGGEFSGKIRAWEKYGDFVQTFTRWLMGEELPPGIGLRSRLRGTELTIDLFYEGENWERTFSTRPPLIMLSEGRDAEKKYPLTWQRMAPGHYNVVTHLQEGALIRGAVKAGEHAMPFGPIIVGSSTEWAFEPERIEDLRLTAAQSGGSKLLDLTDAWQKPKVRQFTDIRHSLFIALLAILILDALFTRLGWSLPKFAVLTQRRAPKDLAAAAAQHSREQREPATGGLASIVRETKAASAEFVRKKAQRKEAGAERRKQPDKPPAEGSESPAQDRRSRFARAKRRR